MTFCVAEVAIPISIALDEQFDYSIPEELTGQVSCGSRVIVPFRTRRCVGYVTKLKSSSRFSGRLRSLSAVLDQMPLIDDDLMALASRLRDEYFCSLGEAISCVLPHGLRFQKTNLSVAGEGSDQMRISASSLKSGGSDAVLPGSGIMVVADVLEQHRWDLYARLIKKTLGEKRGVIFLVPEHVRITQALKRLALSVEPYILSSHLTASVNLKNWMAIKSADTPFVVGTRSAIFSPVKNPGLIVVDDEAHFAYRQEQVPLYDARTIAQWRAGSSTLIVLGACVPSLETHRHVQQARGDGVACCYQAYSPEGYPLVTVIDTKSEHRQRNRAQILSKPTEFKISQALDAHEKILILCQRKGFSTYLYCSHCHAAQTCPRCSLSLRYDFARKTLSCPVCHLVQPSVDRCPVCQKSYIKYGGFGVEKLSNDVSRIFPQARAGLIEKNAGGCGGRDIIVATMQILDGGGYTAGSWDRVVVLEGERLLGRAHFDSTEKAFGQLYAAALLAKKELILQSQVTEHYAISCLKRGDREGFLKEELDQRRELQWPPVLNLGRLLIRSRNEQSVQKLSDKLFRQLKQFQRKNPSCDVFEPRPSQPYRVRDNYRYEILMRYRDVKTLSDVVWSCLESGRRGQGIVTFAPQVS